MGDASLPDLTSTAIAARGLGLGVPHKCRVPVPVYREFRFTSDEASAGRACACPPGPFLCDSLDVVRTLAPSSGVHCRFRLVLSGPLASAEPAGHGAHRRPSRALRAA